MKYFPFKTILLCIAVLPFLYMGSLAALEKVLEPLYARKLENRIVADSSPLLEGALSVEDLVARNVASFLKGDFLVRYMGLELEIRVSTQAGTVVYPPYEYLVESAGSKGFPAWDTRGTARRNYEILEQGLAVAVIASLDGDATGSILILLAYCLTGCLLFAAVYRRGARRILLEQEGNLEKLRDLMEAADRQRDELALLAEEKRQMEDSLLHLQETAVEDLKKASVAEEELMGEILDLEEKLKANTELQEAREKELSDLREQLEKSDRRQGGQKRRHYELAEKRFGVLYKNVDMTRRALSGFFDLDPDLQIKAEEVVHQLNEDVSKVIVKRKVFAGKKNRSMSLEVLFAYTGRLYFRQTEANRVEILVIGTKNTQNRDMEYLHSL
jgi:hypothetical protein